MRATMLAVALPGLGQVYNRKYWKMPFVYAGFGGVIFAISYISTKYNKFMKAYQDFTDEIPQTDSYLKLIKNADLLLMIRSSIPVLMILRLNHGKQTGC